MLPIPHHIRICGTNTRREQLPRALYFTCRVLEWQDDQAPKSEILNRWAKVVACNIEGLAKENLEVIQTWFNSESEGVRWHSNSDEHKGGDRDIEDWKQSP
jgi:hypothetical protein